MAESPGALRALVDRLRVQRADAAAARRNRDAATGCFYCGVIFGGGGEGRLARTVDHRVPKGGGGTDGLANLVFACRACNERKADRPEASFVASGWLVQRRSAVAAGEIGPDLDPEQGSGAGRG